MEVLVWTFRSIEILEEDHRSGIQSCGNQEKVKSLLDFPFVLLDNDKY